MNVIVFHVETLRADFAELNNRIDDPKLAAVAADLERRLLNWYLETSDVTPFQPDSRKFPK